VKAALRNLLTNAIKFTGNGGKVDISAKQTGNRIKVKINDTGSGISPEDLNKLFRIDTNYKTIGRSSEKGTGLGLLICKELIEKMNGEVGVESSPGKGSTFHFTLPVPDEII